MRVVIANTSPDRQERWVTVALPLGQGPQTDLATFGHGFLAAKGPQVGTHSQLWDIRADVPGNGRLELIDYKPITADMAMAFPKPHFSDWIEAGRLTPVVRITVAGVTMTLRVTTWAIAFSNAARIRWALAAQGYGWHVRMWADTWLWQDVIDWRGFVAWSDPANPRERIRASVSVELGEPWKLTFNNPTGDTHPDPTGGWCLLNNKEIVDGVAIPFRGVILLEDKTPATPEPEREAMKAAAVGGPLVATCTDWSGKWLAHGRILSYGRDTAAAKAAVGALTSKVGTILDERPLANTAETGRSGEQPCFGATKDLLALSGDPLRLYEMMWSADDYLLRGLLHYEPTGRLVTAAAHPGRLTWSGLTHPASSDTLGKNVADRPYGWDAMETSGAAKRLAGVDDQHRGDLYIQAYYALTGDPCTKEQLLHHHEADLARSFRANKWLDAPRAAGRLFQSWANNLLLMPERVEATIQMAKDELALWQQKIDAQVEVPWLQDVIADTVLPGKVAAMPWHEALWVLGALAMARALVRIGRPEDAKAFQAGAEKVSANLLKHGTLVGHDGLTYVLNGVAITGDWSAQPESYYQWPRPKAVLQNATAADDLLVGTPGWVKWWSGVVTIGRDSSDPLVKQRAEALFEQDTGHLLTLTDAEWWSL